MGKTTSVVLSDEIDRALDDMAAESVQRQDVEQMSRSEIMRKCIREGIDQFDLADLLSEERRILLQREQFMDEKAKVRNLRTGFETRVKRHFKNRFENGYKPDQLDRFAENMIRDAHLLWPEWSESDYSERRREAIEYVEAVASEAKRAADRSTYDPLDPQEIFDSYEGVREGDVARSVEDVPDEIRSEIASRIERGMSADAIADAIANQYPVERDVAESVVDAARTASGASDRDRPALSVEAMLDD